MARVLTALEIQPGAMRLLQGVWAGGGITVQLFASEPLSAAPEAEQLRGFLQRHGVLGEKVMSCLPVGRVAVRDLEFPFREAGKIRDALPFAMEPLLPYPVEEAVLDFFHRGQGPPWPVRVLAAEASGLRDHLRLLEQAGVTPFLVSDPVTVLIGGLLAAGELQGGGEEAVIAVEAGQVLVLAVVEGRERLRRLLRWNPADDDGRQHLIERIAGAVVSASATEPNLPHRVVVVGEGAEEEGLVEALERRLGLPLHIARLGLPAGAAVGGEQWTSAAFVTYGLLLQGAHKSEVAVDFHHTHSPWVRELQQLRRHATAYALAVGLVLGLVAANLYAGHAARSRAYEELRASLRDRFVAVMPAGTRVVNETAQVTARIQELEASVAFFEDLVRPGGQPLVWLNLLSSLLPADLQLEVQSMTIDGKDIRMQGTVKDFEAVERLKGVLRGAPAFAAVDVRDAKLAVDQKRVRFMLVLVPEAGGPA